MVVVELKVRKIGRSLGVVLPKEVLDHLNATEGDSLILTNTTDGHLQLEAAGSEFAKQMSAARSVARRYRNALRELAK